MFSATAAHSRPHWSFNTYSTRQCKFPVACLVPEPISVPVPGLPRSIIPHLPCFRPTPILHLFYSCSTPARLYIPPALLPTTISPPEYQPSLTEHPHLIVDPGLPGCALPHHSCCTTMSTMSNSSIRGFQNNILARSQPSQLSRPLPNLRVSCSITMLPNCALAMDPEPSVRPPFLKKGGGSYCAGDYAILH